ncbi:hypothetical protein JTB14_011254 [Gonioctena quinquepunctata]|nr:hypothetical protein JTB14_011254 [Gonioctena quinquepunctata]
MVNNAIALSPPQYQSKSNVCDIREQVKKCKFDTLQEGLMKCMIICGVRNNEIWEKLLQNDSYTLDQAIDLCRVMEKSKEQCKEMENDGGSSEIGAIKKTWNISN